MGSSACTDPSWTSPGCQAFACAEQVDDQERYDNHDVFGVYCTVRLGVVGVSLSFPVAHQRAVAIPSLVSIRHADVVLSDVISLSCFIVPTSAHGPCLTRPCRANLDLTSFSFISIHLDERNRLELPENDAQAKAATVYATGTMSLRAGLLRQRCLIAGPSRLSPGVQHSRIRIATSYAWTGNSRTYATPGKQPHATPAPISSTSASAATAPSTPAKATAAHNHDEHDHAHGDGHSHSGLFHSHDHSHSHSEGAEQLIEAMRTGHLDRGTKITLLGG